MAWRDECSDTARMGGAGQTFPNVTTDFGPTTVAEQNALGGYNKSDLPVGGPAPRQKITTGSAD